MVFSSITFLFYFLPVIIGAYYLAPCKIRNLVLLAGSLFFYAWGEPVYVFLMIISIGLNYAAGILIDKDRNKWILAAGVAVNILILGFFKYADFLIDTVNRMFSFELAYFELPLPIGISFYTFQAMSYLIDIYRRDVKVQRNVIDFATYIALFPQLIAGPIVRLKTIEDKLHRREHNWELFGSGVRRFVIGLGKKVLIANNMGIIWDCVSKGDLTQTPVLTAWIGIAAFTLQIYFDFSGYSDMAIGLGRMFGFEFPENFRHPYMSKSITEFWRRWHITLGSWFREYVYIPLGGNRKGIGVQIINIVIVWFLTGLWHGASWNFALWGLYFAVILVLEKLFLLKLLKRIPAVFSHIYTILLVMVSWVIFSLEDTGEIIQYLGSMTGFTSAGFADSMSIYLLTGNLILFLIAGIGATSYPVKMMSKTGKLMENRGVLKGMAECILMIAVLILCTAFITASTYNPFLYFRF
ncbi:MAG: MBOAT family protein [Clostridiales bacterium]|nr:MBOAT family protein [Clostridiales bacterium]